MNEILSPNLKLIGIDAESFEILSRERVCELTSDPHFFDENYWIKDEVSNLKRIYNVESAKKYSELESVKKTLEWSY